MFMRAPLLVALAALFAGPAASSAQTTTTGTAPTDALPGRCASFVAPASRVSDSARIAARDIAGRAQASSIVGDNAAAIGLYRKAAQLDPTDASIAYALGREYEAARDTRAMGEYCRFLALTPQAAEAADVRQRIAELAFALPPDTTVVRVPVTARAQMPAPGAAFGGGLIIPGLGQFITHRPAGGLLVMAATGAAIFYGLQSQIVSSQVTNTGTDPFGNPYQYQTTVTRTERPHAAVGFGAAAAISLSAAIEALVHAQSSGDNSSDKTASAAADSRRGRAVYPVLTFGRHSIGFVVALR